MRHLLIIAGLVAALSSEPVHAQEESGALPPLQAAQLILSRQPQAELAAWQAMTRAGLPIVSDHPHDEALVLTGGRPAGQGPRRSGEDPGNER